MVCMILLWLGVGNVLSIVLPTRDEPIRQRKQSGSLKQFIIAFVVSYAIGYLVNGMLVWRVFAARELTERLGNALIPAIIIMLIQHAFMWILLTVFAVALSQQPKIRRTMQKEITDYKANAEMKAFEQEAAAEAASGQDKPRPPGRPRGPHRSLADDEERIPVVGPGSAPRRDPGRRAAGLLLLPDHRRVEHAVAIAAVRCRAGAVDLVDRPGTAKQLSAGSNPRVGVHSLITLLYPVVALFALAYYLIARNDPAQFDGLVTRTDALYFTIVTLGTIGYGDVHAVGQFARVITMIQIAFDLVVIGAFVAVASSRVQVLLAERSTDRRGQPADPRSSPPGADADGSAARARRADGRAGRPRSARSPGPAWRTSAPAP